MKPYSLDVALGVAITLVAASAIGPTPSAHARLDGRPRRLRSWFSFASAFIVAGCGTVLLIDSLVARRFRVAGCMVLIGVAWLANFLVSYRASRAMLSPYTTMYVFWDFAFLPLTLPPTRDGLFKAAGLLLEVFVNPLNLLAPPGSRLGFLVPLSLLLIGCCSLAQRAGKTFLLLTVPIALAVVASVTRHYPFHGRLILELVPALFLLIAEGTDRATARFPSRSRIAPRTIVAALLVFPCWYACNDVWALQSREFNPHGDLHRNVFIDLPIGEPRLGPPGR